MASQDSEVAASEILLNHELGRSQCGTLDEAKKFVAFAIRCVRGTPMPDGKSPYDCLPAPCRQLFEIVERWLVGEATARDVSQAENLLREMADSKTPHTVKFVGAHAALRAAACTTEAAECTSRIGTRKAGMIDAAGQVSDAANDVVPAAIQAASLCRQAAAGNERQAIEFQRGLLHTIWGEEIGITP